jgi:hypothetical protein
MKTLRDECLVDVLGFGKGLREVKATKEDAKGQKIDLKT